MSSFAAWGLTILGLAVVSTVAEMLLPHGKTQKVIRSVFATIAVLVIVTPIPSLLKNGFAFDFTGDAVQTDEAYLEYVDGVKERMVASAAADYLDGKGYPSDKYILSVTLGGGWNVKSVSIEFVNSSMPENGAHINKSEIIKLIADYFDIGEEAIMTYG